MSITRTDSDSNKGVSVHTCSAYYLKFASYASQILELSLAKKSHPDGSKKLIIATIIKELADNPRDPYSYFLKAADYIKNGAQKKFTSEEFVSTVIDAFDIKPTPQNRIIVIDNELWEPLDFKEALQYVFPHVVAIQAKKYLNIFQSQPVEPIQVDSKASIPSLSVAAIETAPPLLLDQSDELPPKLLKSSASSTSLIKSSFVNTLLDPKVAEFKEQIREVLAECKISQPSNKVNLIRQFNPTGMKRQLFDDVTKALWQANPADFSGPVPFMDYITILFETGGVLYDRYTKPLSQLYPNCDYKELVFSYIPFVLVQFAKDSIQNPALKTSVVSVAPPSSQAKKDEKSSSTLTSVSTSLKPGILSPPKPVEVVPQSCNLLVAIQNDYYKPSL